MECPMPRYQGSVRMLSNLEGTIDLSVIKTWLRICDQKHGAACRVNPDLHIKPGSLRLIDVNTKTIVDAHDDALYVALSYVWGSRGKTSHGHLPDNPSTSDLSGLSEVSILRQLPRRLPATFEDAITVCKNLEERYLWIDLFCIDQSNPHDLQHQINQMNSIYQAATFTIIAKDSTDAYEGLPGISVPLRKRRQPTISTPHGTLTATYIRPPLVLSGKAPWDLRGWTLQEAIFSHRRLIFSHHTVRMMCEQEYFHDTMVNTLSPRYPARMTDRMDWRNSVNSIDINLPYWDFRTFNCLVSIYTNRILRYPDDILNAVQGTLAELRLRTGTAFIYGIPTTDAHRGLLWTPHFSHTLTRRPGNWPSWCWSGWMGRVSWRLWVVMLPDYEDEADLDDPHVSILNCTSHKRRQIETQNITGLPPSQRSDARRDPETRNTLQPAILRFPANRGPSVPPVLEVTSLIASCVLVRVPTDAREPTILTYADDEVGTANKKDLGYHWTIKSPYSKRSMKDSDSLVDIANSTGEPDIFAKSDHFLRLSEEDSSELEILATIASGKTNVGSRKRGKNKNSAVHAPAELILIKHYDLIRDSEEHDAWLANMVACLVVVPAEEDPEWEVEPPDEEDASSEDRHTNKTKLLSAKVDLKVRRLGMALLERGTFEAFGPKQGERDIV